jgi:hypothetical protein
VKCIQNLGWKNLKERNHMEDLGRIIIERTLEKYVGKVWNGCIGIRIGTSGRLLRTWH